MESRRVVFVSRRNAELEPFEVDLSACGPDEVWLRTRYSLVSAGTEGATFDNRAGNVSYPVGVGYAAVGEVIREGTDFPDVRVGDLALSYTPHQGLARARLLCVPLPRDLDPSIAVFARLASVAMTALWVSSAQLGDDVAVIGQGVVGNLCAQLFQASGANVIVIDRAERRLEVARQVGVGRRILARDEAEVRREVLARTGGRGVQVAVEAVGLPSLAVAAAAFTRRLGEVVLLGSPRGEHVTDVTALLNRIHLWENGCVTFKGAHEWRFPVRDLWEKDPNSRHSLEHNTHVALAMLLSGRLRVRELITHVVPPEQAQVVYEGACDRQEEYLGVLFDWTNG